MGSKTLSFPCLFHPSHFNSLLLLVDFYFSYRGYLSIAYALKFPDRVDKLMFVLFLSLPSSLLFLLSDHPFCFFFVDRRLISPAGIPLNPEPAPVAAAQQELKPRTEIASGSPASSTPSTEVQKEGPKPGSRPRLRQFVAWAWEQGWSPFGILRGESC